MLLLLMLAALQRIPFVVRCIIIPLLYALGGGADDDDGEEERL